MNPASPLDQLRDIHLPEPVSMFPAAVGWYLLALFIVIALISAVWLFFWHRNKSTYRRQALSTLEQLQASQATPAEINQLIKRVAVTAYGKERVAPLTGEQWTHWLKATSNTTMDTEVDDLLVSGIYQANAQVSSRTWQFAENWIKNHRTPTPKTTSNYRSQLSTPAGSPQLADSNDRTEGINDD